MDLEQPVCLVGGDDCTLATLFPLRGRLVQDVRLFVDQDIEVRNSARYSVY